MLGIKQELQVSTFIPKLSLDLERKNQQIKAQFYHRMSLILQLPDVLVDMLHKQVWI